mmetsp:Transcript_11637/g.17649  ORF Transcript_11637/g.17649 Transcript_11637/m.17649 type:complete len:406 (-) Transcript_11637:951-2168(-)
MVAIVHQVVELVAAVHIGQVEERYMIQVLVCKVRHIGKVDLAAAAVVVEIVPFDSWDVLVHLGFVVEVGVSLSMALVIQDLPFFREYSLVEPAVAVVVAPHLDLFLLLFLFHRPVFWRRKVFEIHQKVFSLQRSKLEPFLPQQDFQVSLEDYPTLDPVLVLAVDSHTFGVAASHTYPAPVSIAAVAAAVAEAVAASDKVVAETSHHLEAEEVYYLEVAAVVVVETTMSPFQVLAVDDTPRYHRYHHIAVHPVFPFPLTSVPPWVLRPIFVPFATLDFEHVAVADTVAAADLEFFLASPIPDHDSVEVAYPNLVAAGIAQVVPEVVVVFAVAVAVAADSSDLTMIVDSDQLAFAPLDCLPLLLQVVFVVAVQKKNMTFQWPEFYLQYFLSDYHTTAPQKKHDPEKM